MPGFEWQPIILTIKLAFLTTSVLLIIGIPLAYYLAYSKTKWKAIPDTLISLPLVLPPSVMGFYFLVVFSPESFMGKILLNTIGIKLVFTFTGVLIASIIFSMPFMVEPLKTGFLSIPSELKDASYTLGKTRIYTLFRVLLPNMKPSLLSGIIITFAHSIGAFGIILMIGGNIPGETRVAAIAVYSYLDSLNYQAAHQYAFILLGFSFVVILAMKIINNCQKKHWEGYHGRV